MNLFEKLGYVKESALGERVEDVTLTLQNKLDNLITENKKLKKDLGDAREKFGEASIKIDVLEERIEDSRDLARKEIELRDNDAVLSAVKEGLDRREVNIAERLRAVEEEETDKYQEGYADGVADGLRKAHEITRKDREDAMKVAMVAAASHTLADTVRYTGDSSVHL